MNMIKHSLQIIWNDIKESAALWMAGYRLSVAIRMADYKQRAYNRQYIVYPVGAGQLKVYSRRDVEALKRLPYYNRKWLVKWRKAEYQRIEDMKKINYDNYHNKEITLNEYCKNDKEISFRKSQIEGKYDQLKRTKVIDRTTTWDWLKNNAYYRTPISRNNSQDLTDTERLALRKQWLKDFTSLRKKGMA